MVPRGPSVFTYASVVNRTGERNVENQAVAFKIPRLSEVTLLRKMAKASKKAMSDSKEKDNPALRLGGELEYL